MHAEQNPLWFADWFREHRPTDYAYVSDSANTKTIKRTNTELLEIREDLKNQLRELEAMLEEAA